MSTTHSPYLMYGVHDFELDAELIEHLLETDNYFHDVEGGYFGLAIPIINDVHGFHDKYDFVRVRFMNDTGRAPKLIAGIYSF